MLNIPGPGESSAADGIGRENLTPLAALALSTVRNKCSYGMYHMTVEETKACPCSDERTTENVTARDQ